MFALERLGWL